MAVDLGHESLSHGARGDARSTRAGAWIARASLAGWHAVALAWLLAWGISAIALVRIQLNGRELMVLQAFNLAEHCTLAFLGYLGVKLWSRLTRATAWANFCALLLTSVFLSWLVLADDFSNFSERQRDLLPPWLTLAASTLVIAGTVPLAWWISWRWASRPWVVLAGALMALGGLVANQLLLPGDYHGVHLFLTLICVVALATLLTKAPFAALLARAPGLFPIGTSRRTVLLLLGCLVSAALMVLTPPGTIRAAWLRSESAPLYRLLARARGALEASDETLALRSAGEWFAPRGDGFVPPTHQPRVLDNPLVLLITVDALRADLIAGEYDATLPVLARLREESLWFANARAPGTLTKVSVTSVFMGKYFSQQYWAKTERGIHGVVTDPTLRFPEYLSQAGVKTVNFRAIGWLRNGPGHVKGFSEEHHIKSKRQKYAPARPVMKAILKRLEKVGHEPLFLHTHLSDPHAPYNLATSQGSDFERYLAEVALVDQELGRLIQALERHGLDQRAILIVQADHGEAFGEHGSRTHGTTLYDEVLRVPVLIRLPNAKGKRIDDAITTMDLGPTVLELFALPVPRYFMGQSLVPFLRGERAVLTRPILAENRLQQTLISPRGLKVIHDTRTKTAELYDLNVDPGELEDLSSNSELLAEPLATLHAFFETHRYKGAGYQPPYLR